MDELKLSERQVKLLKAILSEFIDTAEAVGSIHLPTKYNLKISPATVRNEMVSLAEKGLLKKNHASSGRTPTSRAFRFFISEILDEYKELEAEQEARIREHIFHCRFDINKLLYEGVKKLAEITSSISIALFENRIYYAGLTQLVRYPEYQHHHRLHNILSVIENAEALNNLFEKNYSGQDDIYILIGEDDTGLRSLQKSAIIYGKLFLHDDHVGYIAVLGPYRMNYKKVIPAVRWMVKTINSSAKGW